MNLNAANSSADKGGVPKLDFRNLKQTQDYRDWYQYALKLEDSVKFLRTRIQKLEEDNDDLNKKYRAEQQLNENTTTINKRLAEALSAAKARITAVKEKYRARFPKKCLNCGQSLKNASNISDFVSHGGGASDIDVSDLNDIMNDGGMMGRKGNMHHQAVKSSYADDVYKDSMPASRQRYGRNSSNSALGIQRSGSSNIKTEEQKSRRRAAFTLDGNQEL